VLHLRALEVLFLFAVAAVFGSERRMAAIILWNSRYLASAFDNLRRDRQPLGSEIMRHVPSLGWEHISLTGDYIWNERSRLANGQLRPLRQPPSLLAA
jgi:hypothetical protein